MAAERRRAVPAPAPAPAPASRAEGPSATTTSGVSGLGGENPDARRASSGIAPSNPPGVGIPPTTSSWDQLFGGMTRHDRVLLAALLDTVLVDPKTQPDITTDDTDPNPDAAASDRRRGELRTPPPPPPPPGTLVIATRLLPPAEQPWLRRIKLGEVTAPRDTSATTVGRAYERACRESRGLVCVRWPGPGTRTYEDPAELIVVAPTIAPTVAAMCQADRVRWLLGDHARAHLDQAMAPQPAPSRIEIGSRTTPVRQIQRALEVLTEEHLQADLRWYPGDFAVVHTGSVELWRGLYGTVGMRLPPEATWGPASDRRSTLIEDCDERLLRAALRADPSRQRRPQSPAPQRTRRPRRSLAAELNDHTGRAPSSSEHPQTPQLDIGGDP